MATVMVSLDRVGRALAVENAVASVRLEGLEPPDEAKTIYQRYVNGELTLDEMGRAIDDYADLKYGPVRLPRNAGT
jgi:hypothetical protein